MDKFYGGVVRMSNPGTVPNGQMPDGAQRVAVRTFGADQPSVHRHIRNHGQRRAASASTYTPEEAAGAVSGRSSHAADRKACGRGAAGSAPNIQGSLA